MITAFTEKESMGMFTTNRHLMNRKSIDRAAMRREKAFQIKNIAVEELIIYSIASLLY